LLNELEAVAKSHTIKAYLCFYFDAEDSFEDDLDHYVAVKLFALKSSHYVFRTLYRTWDSDWEHMLYNGTYITDEEFLSNFWMDRECIQHLNRMVEHDEVFSQCWGKRARCRQCYTSWCYSNI